jgi:hypothetical protein
MTTPPPPPPESISLLVEFLGVDGTLRLIEARGGTRFWVPSGVGRDVETIRGKLEAEFGVPMVKALIQGFGGGYIKVPLCRDWRIALYRHRGMTMDAVALKVGSHVDTVRRHLALGPRENRQAAWEF